MIARAKLKKKSIATAAPWVGPSVQPDRDLHIPYIEGMGRTFKMSRATCLRVRDKGEIPTVNIAGRLMVRLSAVDAWLARKEKEQLKKAPSRKAKYEEQRRQDLDRMAAKRAAKTAKTAKRRTTKKRAA